MHTNVPVLLLLLAITFSVSSAQTGTTVALNGTVVDQAGAPIPAAKVFLYDDSTQIAQAITGSYGQFSFAKVGLKDAYLVVRAKGFAEHKHRWTNNARQLQIVLAPAPISEQVVVTPTRTDSRLGDATSSIAVLGSQQLATTSALRLDDALRQVSGFQLFRRSGSRTANPTIQGVSLRGIGSSGASRALVLFDAIPLNDPFGGWIYWGRVPRESVDHIEVLRTGASHLYGSGALGGVVNIFSRHADTPVLSVDLSYGNQQTPSGSLFAAVNNNNWTASLDGELSHTDGYIIVPEDERGNVDTPAGSRHSVLNLKLERRISDRGNFFIRGEVFSEERRNGTTLQTNDTNLRQLSAGLDLQTKQLGNFKLRLYGSAQVFDQSFTAVAADRNTEALTRLQRVPSQSTAANLQWSQPIGSHALVAGFEVKEVRGASDELAFVQGRPSFFVGSGGRERTLGAFAHDSFQVNSRLSIAGGARVDRWREFGGLSATRPVTSAQPTSVQSFADRTETALSPNLSFLYAASDRLSLSTSFSKAFRPPTLNELYRAFRVGDVLTLANENLRAERLTGGEAAARVYLFDQKLSSRFALFWNEITGPVANVTIAVAPTLITRQRQNLGSTRSRGIEIETEARFSERWLVTGGYLFADATVLEFSANTSLEGLRIPQVARHQFTLQTRYTNPSWITIGLQARGGGEQFDDDQNLLPLGGYFQLDAFASRRVNRNVDMFVAAENLLNQRYKVGRTPVTTIGPPILVRAGIRLRLRG